MDDEVPAAEAALLANNIALIEEPEEERIPSVMGPDDSRRMNLTDEEVDWALDIRDAIGMMPELDAVSDFFCVQLALIVKDDVGEAVERAMGLQAFKEEYNILDTYEEGSRCLRGLVHLLPRMWLSFAYSHDDGMYVEAHDLPKFDVSLIHNPEKVRTFLAGIYYMHHAMNSDFAGIRKGTIVLVECEGFDWTKKATFNFQNRVFTELLSHYPYCIEGRHYNTGAVFNIYLSMLRKLLPEKLKKTLQVGFQLDERLDKYFLVPTVEAAEERMLLRLEECLRRRYENIKAYSFPSDDESIKESVAG